MIPKMLIFDIETDGLLDTCTKIHCMSISDGEGHIDGYTPDKVYTGICRLQHAIDNNIPIVGHNIINFDIPAICKLYPWFNIPREKRHLVVDTLVLTRLLEANVGDRDADAYREGHFAGALIGSQTLKAWGYRLGELKGTYANDHDDAWGCYNEDMLNYNIQDVRVTEKLIKYLHSRLLWSSYQKAIKLEHEAQWLMTKQEQNGFPFDKEKALILLSKLRERQGEVSKAIMSYAPPIPDKVFVPKRDNARLGYVKGVPIQRYKDFNPNSRQQIEWLFRTHYSYEPQNEDLYAEDGRLKVDETTFHWIASDPDAPKDVHALAELLEESLLLSKRLGQLSDGTWGWLKCIGKDGKIHGRVNPNGAVTGRATHSQPNVTQVPHNSSPYGKECRELFRVPEGWVQAGIDACGLELRCLSHFLYPYDNGAYAEEVVHGDIHTANQKAAGLPTRDNAKTFNIMGVYKSIENGETLM